ncbi:MAG: hypothetical protein FWG82_05375 [Oscillospiraceae bacterium]|nr:hypothetical protein [Oscillospiraceae bacterium]
MDFIQEIIIKIGELFKDAGGGISGFIDALVAFVNGIIDKEARFDV